MDEEKSELILSGSYLYDNTLRLSVRIERRPIRYGSGDWGDYPEIRDDAEIPTYVAWFETADGTPKWVGGGQFSTLEEAKEQVANDCASLRWD
ncbi:MAG TPA: hypothetical protein VF481_10215 [Novosphingobium sp.]